MLGLGKWKFHVEMFLFTGDVIVNVLENNGEYVFEPVIEGFNDELSYEIIDVKVKDNVITGTARASLIPGNKVVVATLKFEDDSFNPSRTALTASSCVIPFFFNNASILSATANH